MKSSRNSPGWPRSKRRETYVEGLLQVRQLRLCKSQELTRISNMSSSEASSYPNQQFKLRRADREKGRQIRSMIIECEGDIILYCRPSDRPAYRHSTDPSIDGSERFPRTRAALNLTKRMVERCSGNEIAPYRFLLHVRVAIHQRSARHGYDTTLSEAANCTTSATSSFGDCILQAQIEARSISGKL